ncbi:UNVERIFIED_CONTAM: hypothetical protein GTU68_043614 [Idotea baltica]|nr:hypothetical protein [Idotea baltica]
MGGSARDANYRAVITGNTGHAEVVELRFDSERVSYEELLNVFWMIHDPTTLNQQGNDRGPQYRSVIFYHSELQRALAEQSKISVEAKVYKDPVITVLASADVFYPAEDRHQNYYQTYPFYGYCRSVISPKMAKLRKEFYQLIKQEYIGIE